MPAAVHSEFETTDCTDYEEAGAWGLQKTLRALRVLRASPLHAFLEPVA